MTVWHSYEMKLIYSVTSPVQVMLTFCLGSPSNLLFKCIACVGMCGSSTADRACVLERGRGHETVITDSIHHLKKDPAVLLSRAHCSDDEEDADMPVQSAGSDCVQSHISTQTHSYHTGLCVNK